jgi:hypothetical protein
MTSSEHHIVSITRACNVFKECGPMITSILRNILQFNTLLIFIIILLNTIVYTINLQRSLKILLIRISVLYSVH